MDSIERQRLRHVWRQMIKRCHDADHIAYHNYGGRGIAVCERWRASFDAFLEDMGPRPSRGHSIERIDNDKGYSPKNCAWVTRSAQNLNKRDYRNNTSGHRNIQREIRAIKGRKYCYWRVRVRRNGRLVTLRRFHSIDDAIAHRDQVEKENAHAGA